MNKPPLHSAPRPSKQALEHRLRSLKVYLDSDGQSEAIVKNTERDILAILLSKEHTLRSMPSLMKEIDRLLASQEKALIATIENGLTGMGEEGATHAIDAQ